MDAHTLANRLEALLRCAMLAEENETSGLDHKGNAQVLELAVEMAGQLAEKTEQPASAPEPAQ